ncbi:E3 ubiquitin-protein ligase DTX4 [Apteryx rowi]|uniref:E3 ubiquitin-protein ligase DTX4 n=1 Tax=Apteryx rowi TaxID=308060 RepID=UPI000E1E266C|nr:E3 ubiquitin-protein ligase DTX4 [Apteryx rowi]
MLLASAAVVWEWLNEHGRWRPYGPAVSHHIEAVARAGPRAGGSVVLGQADSRLAPYIIDLQSMHQFRQDTGTIRPVRRSYYDPSSAPGKGVVWEWENDSGSWTPYDMDVGITIQRAYEKQHPWVDLSAIGFCYVIDFATMGQINRQTRRKRRVRRRLDMIYPLVSGALPKSQSWPASPGAGAAPLRRPLLSPRVPTVPVKNLTGSSPVNPALAGITGILMSAAGLPVCLTRPPKLVLHPPPVSKSDIQAIPGIGHTCRKTTKKQAKKGKTPEEVLKKYLQKVRHPPDEDCTICMERLSAPSGYKGPQPAIKPDLVGKLAKCGHVFHLHCLVAMYNNGNKDGSLQCPTCKTIYGVKTGTQPPGKMEYHIIPHALPGHSDCKTIRIIYNIPPGVQGPEHPNPGKSFTARGFPRHCYLPDSEKGRKVLKLLLVAWDRRLIFAIGTSSTTGESDTVIWNEIHHKTEFGSNLTGHGYPDGNYLDNVLAELAAQGITEESLAQEKD